MIQVTFEPMTTGEKKILTFPFGTQMAVGETISSATVAASVYSGTDASPSDLISGSDSTSGTNITQLIDATLAVEGVVYKLICTAVTSLSQTLQCMGFLVIRPSA